MKRTKILTLAVASVMALSAVALASCGGEKKPTGGLVSDESLKSKIIAAYTFENGGEAVDAYTGAALGQYDLNLTSDETVTGRTGKGITSGDTVAKMPKFGSAVSESTGFSVTYSYKDTGTFDDSTNPDWHPLLNTEEFTITYGNVGGKYPTETSILRAGRGAYSNESYAAAQEALSSRQLAKYSKYTAYNAVFPEGSASAEGSTVNQIYKQYINNWNVVTLNITTEEVGFYINGAFAISYASSDFDGGIEKLLAAISDYTADDVDYDAPAYLFGGGCGDIDDVVFGTALSDQEVLALYNNLSGDTKTWEDVSLSSKMAGANAADAKDDATAKINAKRVEAAAAKKAAAQGDVYGTIENGKGTTVWYSSFPVIDGIGLNTVTELKFVNVIGGGANTYIGYFTAAGDVADANIAHIGLMGNSWYSTADKITGADAVSNIDMDGAEITYKVTKTQNAEGKYVMAMEVVIVPADAGVKYEESATVGDATETVTLEIPESYTVTYEFVADKEFTNINFNLDGNATILISAETTPIA